MQSDELRYVEDVMLVLVLDNFARSSSGTVSARNGSNERTIADTSNGDSNVTSAAGAGTESTSGTKGSSAEL